MKYTNTLYRFYLLVGKDSEGAPGLDTRTMRCGDGGSRCDRTIEYVAHSGDFSWGNEEVQSGITIHSVALFTMDDSSIQLGCTLLTIE